MAQHRDYIYLDTSACLPEVVEAFEAKRLEIEAHEADLAVLTAEDRRLAIISFVREPVSFDLSEVREITTDDAKLLASTGWYLPLDAIQELTPRAAYELSNHSGTLSLTGLKDIDEESATLLSRHRGPLLVDVNLLSPNISKILSRNS
ncbi:hypothetical protein DSM3645_14635 [Blastopirellula marina DSM 3645]|uniref:Uncharacterized protein n=1 Tax=Blastopirellula marina DSM 3645 TaxID=314230 RepID=A3ZSD1_9BACT|nr:hypothetical protein DSM3645_14635 [Blastopirellula marina DSM 3645]